MRSRWTIALDATYSLDGEPTGISVYSREILRGLTAAWPEARFLACYRPHRFPRSLRALLPANCRRRVLFEHGWGLAPDLFHGLNQRMPARRFRRAVSTFHDLFVLTAEYSTPDYRRRFAEQARLAAARSDLIIAVSAFTAAQVRDLLGVEPGRIRVVPHGVHLPEAPRGGNREPLVLHVGAIQKRKNLVRLVRAFARVPRGWRLVLAGSAGFGADEVFEEIARSPRRDEILVTGYVPQTRLEELYQRAAVLAFPSLDEGFGLPVLEAMAHGLPVLTSNRSALPEVTGGAALLVDPEDTEALASALEQLALDEDLRQRLAEQGLARAALFPWRRAVEATRRVYEELLG